MNKSVLYIICLIWGFTALGQIERSHATFFRTDKFELTDGEKDRLDTFIKSLPTDSIVGISMYGYCDDRGSESYNNWLSQQRANEIKKEFMRFGVDEDKITAVNGEGELLITRLDSVTTSVQRTLNRKTEIIVDLIGTPDPLLVDGKQTLESIKRAYKTFDDIPLKKGDHIILKDVLFKVNYSYLLPESHEALREVAEVLKQNEHLYFMIQGHVCCLTNGRDAVDLRTGRRDLSIARAKLIYNYLRDQGIEKNRMNFEGLGSRFPLGGDEKLDRRVEIEITYTSNKSLASDK